MGTACSAMILGRGVIHLDRGIIRLVGIGDGVELGRGVCRPQEMHALLGTGLDAVASRPLTIAHRLRQRDKRDKREG